MTGLISENKAQAYLISKLMEKQDYEQAQESVGYEFQKRGMLDREQLQANLYIAQGRVRKAAKLTEEKFCLPQPKFTGADDVNGDRIERKADGRRGIYCGYRQAGGAGI